MSLLRREMEKHGVPITASAAMTAIIRSMKDLCPKEFSGVNYRALSDEDIAYLVSKVPAYPEYQDDFVCFGFGIKLWGDVMVEWARRSNGKEFALFGYAKVHVKGATVNHALNWYLSDEMKFRWFGSQVRTIVTPEIDKVFWVRA